METLELKLTKAVSSGDRNNFQGQKIIERLVIARDSTDFKILFNNEFISLQQGDCLRLNDTLISVSLEKQSAISVLAAMPTQVSSSVATADYLEFKDVDLPIATLNRQHNSFDVDVLLKDKSLSNSNDPLGFLFQSSAQTGLPEPKYPVQPQYRQPLPLLKQHFNAQQITALPENNSHAEVTEIAPFAAEKSPRNILQDLGLSEEPEWNGYKANYLSHLPYTQKSTDIEDAKPELTVIKPPTMQTSWAMARSWWSRITMHGYNKGNPNGT